MLHFGKELTERQAAGMTHVHATPSGYDRHFVSNKRDLFAPPHDEAYVNVLLVLQVLQLCICILQSKEDLCSVLSQNRQHSIDKDAVYAPKACCAPLSTYIGCCSTGEHRGPSQK